MNPLPLRPYLITPKLVEQPTWGGTYIATFKSWGNRFDLAQKKIGQSFELYGDSKLTNICSTEDERFGPETSHDQQALSLSSWIKEDAKGVLGEKIAVYYHVMPILIKFTQALGNSFQLHRKPAEKHDHWIPKAESWYFLEKGTLTYGINTKTSHDAYKSAVKKIEQYMKDLSQLMVDGTLTVADGRRQAKEFIKTVNPWQYVNVHAVDQYSLLDLSIGGIHHSWEEDDALPNGNIVYEVQQDVMDDFCTLRSFDQGKIKDDGTIRTIHIDDYFKFLDVSEEHNTIDFALRRRQGTNLLKTPYYAMDELQISSQTDIPVGASFDHLFVLNGSVTLTYRETTLIIGKGHACFVPWKVGSYALEPREGNATVLKTYIDGI